MVASNQPIKVLACLITVFSVVLLIVFFSVRQPWLSRRDQLKDRPQATPHIHEGSSRQSDSNRINGELALPFLGDVKVLKSSQDESFGMIKFRVWKTRAGRFLRAEYLARGAADPQVSAKILQEGMSLRSEEITGLPSASAKTSWQEIVKMVAERVPIEQATKIDITYVMYRRIDGVESPTYLLNVFGLADPFLGAREDLPGAELRRKARYIFSQDGEFLKVDNCL